MGILQALQDMGFAPTITSGPGVMKGPCPACRRGTDRFTIWLERNTFHCNQCEIHGNFRRFFEVVCALDPKAAAARVREYAMAETPDETAIDANPSPNEIADRAAWIKAVREQIENGELDLADNAYAMAFLHDERGLTDQTIRRFRLGLIRDTSFVRRNRMGLNPYVRADGKTVWSVRLPAGIQIPQFVRGEGPVCLNVRCWDDEPVRHWSVPGSTRASMLISSASGDIDGVVAGVESFLCGMKLNQDTAMTSVALGGVDAPLGHDSVKALDDASMILLAMDNDPAGFAAAESYAAAYPNAVITPAPQEKGKDVTDAWRAGLNLRKFMAAAKLNAAAELSRRRRHVSMPATRLAPAPTRTRASSAAPTVPHETQAATPTVAAESPVATCLRARGYRHITDPNEAMIAVRRLVEENESVAIGVGTAKLCGHEAHPKAGKDPALSTLRLLELCGRQGDAIIIDGPACADAMRDIMDPVLTRRLIAHDGVFAMKHLIHLGVPLTAAIESTELMWNALTNETRTCKDPVDKKLEALSLESVLRRAVGVDVTGDGKRSDLDAGTLAPEQLAHSADHVLHLIRLHDTLLNRLRMKGVEQVYSLTRSSMNAVAQLELDGMFFDCEGHAALVADWHRRQNEVRAELPQGMDISKPEGMDATLREILPPDVIERWPRGQGGFLSSSKDVTAKFPEIPALSSVRAWKALAKLISTYGDSFAASVGPDGRLHSTYSLAGTTSGRLSSHDPALQNIPKDAVFRVLFRAQHDESVLVVADMSQAELRALACLSKDAGMLEAYEKGFDLHRMTASRLLHVNPEDVTKDQRTWGRVVNLALAYGQSAAGLKRNAMEDQGWPMTLEEAKTIRKDYLDAYPRLRRFQEEMIRQALMRHQVSTPGGRVRRFEDGDRKAFTAAINHPAQGAIAESFLHFMAKLPGRLRGLGRLVNVVHDEIVVECNISDSEAVAKTIEEAMAEGFVAVFPKGCTRNLTEPKVCRTWAEAK